MESRECASDVEFGLRKTHETKTGSACVSAARWRIVPKVAISK